MSNKREKPANNKLVADRSNEPNNDQLDYTTFNDLDRGWAWMVLLASFGIFWVLGGNMYALSITQTIFLERYNESVALTSWAGALQSGLMTIGGPISSMVVDRYSCRVALVICGILFVAGNLSTAFVGSMQAAIFTFGVLGGIGGSVGYIANLVVIGFNFKEKRNMALGISSAGTGIGILSFAPLMELSKAYYGNSGFFIITAGVCLHVVLFAVICFPSKLEKHIHAKKKLQSAINQDRNISTFRRKMFDMNSDYCVHVVCNKSVIFLGINKFLHCFGTFVVFVHLSSYIIAEGYSVARTASVLSVIGITSVIGRVLIGLIASIKKVNVLLVYVISDAVLSVATLLFPLYSGQFAGQMAYGVILGLLFGNGYVLITSINIEYVELSHVSAASGFEFFLCGIGSVLGPVVAGFIVDSGGTYKQAFVLGGASILLATVAAAVVLCFPRVNSEVSTQLKDTID